MIRRGWIPFFFFSTLLYGDLNISQCLESISNKVSSPADSTVGMTVGDLGSFFEGTSTHITNLITFYSIFISIILALVSIVYFMNHSRIIKKMEGLEKNIKDEVEREVDRQFMYNAKKMMTKVQNDAYRKIDYNVDEISISAQRKLFDYQQLVYKVVQVKKYAIEEIISNKDLNSQNILLEFINIEGRYNETLNHDLPNLFAEDIHGTVIKTLVKLSEFQELRSIIVQYVNKLLEKGLPYKDESRLREVLNKYYSDQ